jgi:agmatinase
MVASIVAGACPVTAPNPPTTFAKMARRSLADLQGTTVVILGIDEASPYKSGEASHSAGAPTALRAASKAFLGQLNQFDFDIGGTLLATLDDTRGIVDLGDLPTDPADTEGNCTRITQAIAAILQAGAVPVVLGGDDSVPIPALRAYEGRGPLTVVQVDGHTDWGDVIKGNPNGYGSTMRRAAEMPWVTNMVQVGIGGLGSGTADQIADARRWGSHIFTARDIHRGGIQAAIDAIPEGTDCIVTIDCDGLDPALMPAVGMPTPGGIDYLDLLELLLGVAKKGRIAGFFLVEFVPHKDPHGLAALIAARIVLIGIGLIRGVLPGVEP